MRQLAAFDEDTLYRKYGIDAELMIDHAWGREPVTMADIKAYKPESKSISQGQVLMRDYSFDEARIVIREMIEQLALDLVKKGLLTQSVSIYAGYSNALHAIPARGTCNVLTPTNSETVLTKAVLDLYDRITDRSKPIRRFYVYCNNVTEDKGEQQISLFDAMTVTAGAGTGSRNAGAETGEAACRRNVAEVKETDRKIQTAMNDIKEKFGKNAIFKSSDLQEGATQLERNMQIGGHKSGNHE